jgi:hypothetical protein
MSCKEEEMKHIGSRLWMIAVLVLFFPATSPAQVFTYPSTAIPVVNTDPALARPVAVGPAATGGQTLDLQVNTAVFSNPMDVYLGIVASSNPNEVFLFRTDNSLTTLTQGLAVWRSSVTQVGESVLTGFPLANLPPGNYTLALMVTPANTLDNPILWVTLLTPTVSVAVSASGTDTTSAVLADATFTFAAVANSPYTFNISGFGAGDKLVFPVFGGAPNALSIVNPSPTDGIVTVELIRNVGGDRFNITVVLDGLTAAQDQQIVDVDTFNAVFGANSIQQL